MTRLAPRMALGAGSLALAVVGAEAALRLAGYAPLEAALAGRIQLVRESRSPGRGYELVPGAHGAGWGTTVAVNSHGFRGPEVALDAPGRTRVVALGDSVTFGNDLAYEATWPAVLERELGAAGHALDVLDLGLGGYDTAQEVATLAALGLAFRPAHVVVGFCANDVGLVSMSMETAFAPADRANPLYASRLAQWWRARTAERAQRRALFEANLEDAYARRFADEIDPLPPELAARAAALRAAVAAAPAPEQDLASRRIPARWFASEARLGRLSHAFARLAALAGEHGFGVTVLLVPYLEPDPLIDQGLDLVHALAESHGFEVVDPRAEFAAANPAGLRIRPEDPVHPNAVGHALLARALAPSLARALVPPHAD